MSVIGFRLVAGGSLLTPHPSYYAWQSIRETEGRGCGTVRSGPIEILTILSGFRRFLPETGPAAALTVRCVRFMIGYADGDFEHRMDRCDLESDDGLYARLDGL